MRNVERREHCLQRWRPRNVKWWWPPNRAILHGRDVVVTTMALMVFWGVPSGCGSAREEEAPNAGPAVVRGDGANQQSLVSPDKVDERIRRLVSSEFPTLTDENSEAFLMEWGANQSGNELRILTDDGPVEVQLFDDVPIHRANFLYKVYRGYFDPTELTRVVPDFVVQGGNSEEERPQQLRFLIGRHTLPSEWDGNHLHVRGALAMSRSYSDNPDKRSSAYDFYIVTGRKVGERELARLERERGWSYTEDQRRMYREEGGTPHLDGEHTVFGRVVSGMEFVDKLAATPTDDSDWPLTRLEVRIPWPD